MPGEGCSVPRRPVPHHARRWPAASPRAHAAGTGAKLLPGAGGDLPCSSAPSTLHGVAQQHTTINRNLLSRKNQVNFWLSGCRDGTGSNSDATAHLRAFPGGRAAAWPAPRLQGPPARGECGEAAGGRQCHG